MITQKGENHLAAEAERRRLKKESDLLTRMECKATEDEISGKLSMEQIHDLGQNYIKSLQKIMVNVSEKGSN